MASASVMDSPSEAISPGFYETVRKRFSFIKASNDKTRPEDSGAPTVDDKSRERIVDDAKELVPLSPAKITGSKVKNKFGKKKEIVSSSTVVPRVEVCTGKKCKPRGAEELLTKFTTASDGRVEIAYTGCMKACKQGMNARVTKDGTTFEWHHEVSAEDVDPILCKHFEW